MSEHIVKAPHVPPFVTFVTSAVPMVFDNSLSYYEALCALWKWLQDDVVNVINNNATVTEDYIDLTNEYTQKFIELKEYVDTYFDNLDVQEEINNKLDAMVEDGTLQQLIASYLQTQIIYDTTLDMIADAEHLVNGVRVETLGYRSVDDNGAAFFVIKNTGTADGKSVIALDGGLYAHMVYKHDFVTPEMFGAYGDGVNDHNDSDAIQFAINTGKTVEFAPKTYICYSLTVDTPTVLHGNGATLKRPELDIEPYNLTVAEMKWIRTITVNEECTIHNLTFDNNCFTMWQVSDGYTQEQSASVIVQNTTKQIKFNISNCHFKNSAGDGLHIVQNVITNITDCASEDCFRGGFVSSGFGSEINLNGWNSKVITTGINDGFDVELDSASTVNPTLYHLNINNVILDYDFDISIPQYGVANISNVTMRTFDQDTIGGFLFNTEGGKINVENCLLRAGKKGNTHVRLRNGGQININNSELYGNSSEALFLINMTNNITTDSVNITNCKITGYDIFRCSVLHGSVKFDNCDIEATNSFMIADGNTVPQPRKLIISNSSIKFADMFFTFAKTNSADAEGVNIYLSNLVLKGNASSYISCPGGKPNLYFNNLIMEAGIVKNNTYGGSPNYYGTNRVVMVDSATDLTFAGWIAGNDIAIAKDTGTRYQYTSGTTWTAI